MTIDWSALGEVFLVSFGTSVGVIVLFALGVSALAAPTADPASAPGETAQSVTPRPAASRALAVLCFLTCALVAGYGLYLIIVR
ncbi:MAG TPA: hypothetical protein VGO16_02335 [Pseudonocardiaceae bacterium]|nr:hypothetical protein [Pseudonocardiaceae bacterium]